MMMDQLQKYIQRLAVQKSATNVQDIMEQALPCLNVLRVKVQDR